MLPGENEAAFAGLGERLSAELQPVGEMEGLLVERIAAAQWRLRRLGRVEAGIFTHELYGELAERARAVADNYVWKKNFSEPPGESADHVRVMDPQKHREALSRAQEAEDQRREDTAVLGRTFVREADEANAFSKLSRYETQIERSLYRALHELQRLRATRHAQSSVPPPAVVNVDVSGIPGEAPELIGFVSQWLAFPRPGGRSTSVSPILAERSAALPRRAHRRRRRAAESDRDPNRAAARRAMPQQRRARRPRGFPSARSLGQRFRAAAQARHATRAVAGWPSGS